MGYFHHLVCIDKDKEKEFCKEFKRLKQLNSEHPDDFDVSQKFFDWFNSPEEIYCIGEINDSNGPVSKLLYENKIEDLGNDYGEEFFKVNQEDFILKVALAMYEEYLNWLEKMVNDPDSFKSFVTIKRNIFNQSAYNKDGTPSDIAWAVIDTDDFKSYAAELSNIHRKFDYKNKVIYVTAW